MDFLNGRFQQLSYHMSTALAAVKRHEIHI